MRICILMGSANISGGSYVILQHALHAQERGADVTIVTLEPMSHVKVKWHPGLDQLRFATFDEVEHHSFDLAMATWWKTIYELHRIEARQYAYFVQSIESWFYPDSEVALRNLVNSTYLLDLPGVTEATWIRTHLRERFGHEYHLVKNGILKDVYREAGPTIAPRKEGRLRVLVEGPLGVDFKNVARTIELVKRSKADEVWLLTISPIDGYPGVDRVFSGVPAFECPEIYRSCDVLVKLSLIEGMFGPPLEMFHCGGTAVVYNVTGHDEYIEDGVNAVVVRKHDEISVIKAIDRMKEEQGHLNALVGNARRTASQWPDWEQSSSSFMEVVMAIMRAPPVDRHKLRLQTEEYMRQYVRSERGSSGNVGDAVRRLRSHVFSRVARLAGRNSRLAGRVKVFHAYFIESRRLPAAREFI